MNILEKISNLFRKKYKTLPEATTRSENPKNKTWLLKNNMNNKETKLDIEIERFLTTYYNQIEPIEMTYQMDESRLPRAYTALVEMNAKAITQEEYQNNNTKEDELLRDIYTQNRYNLDMQKNKEGRNVFYHIRSKGYQLPPNNEIIRLYINCNNGNVAELAQNILQYNQNGNFYLKLTPNEQNANYSRGEKIVIYCRENEVESNMQLLHYIKSIRPELFKESERTLPFLQSVDNIVSIARQPVTNQYVDLYNRNYTIPQSHNAFLANILQESYMETAREIARNDPNINYLLDDNWINSRILYMKNYKYINEYYHDYLLKSMEAKMEVLSRKNNIYIDGLNYNRNYEENTQEQYYERY